ncbi:hypothetical protein [Bordetella petrii]|uniref:hypothetical protein n=1 Tax=Bordetella petrii TaxID=94624 RepID=UPI00048D7BC9|nr:hypothetical protein [Bordetella petrii]
MELQRQHIEFIDRLREAAQEHGAVADPLSVVDEALLLDDLGNQKFVGDDEDLDWLRVAQLAAKFAASDRLKGAAPRE